MDKFNKVILVLSGLTLCSWCVFSFSINRVVIAHSFFWGVMFTLISAIALCMRSYKKSYEKNPPITMGDIKKQTIKESDRIYLSPKGGMSIFHNQNFLNTLLKKNGDNEN